LELNQHKALFGEPFFSHPCLFYTFDPICQTDSVRVIQLQVADLYAFEGRTPDSNPEPDAIAALARKQFSFLPQPLTVLVEGDNVSLSFPKESEAAESGRPAQTSGRAEICSVAESNRPASLAASSKGCRSRPCQFTQKNSAAARAGF